MSSRGLNLDRFRTGRSCRRCRLSRMFATATCEPNELMATFHDRMPVILAPSDYMRWLGPGPDPRDLMKPFPSHLMKMWPIDSKVRSPRNNTSSRDRSRA